MPPESAAQTCWGEIMWMWVSMPPAVAMQTLARDDLRARTDDQVRVDAVHDVRVAGLADGPRSDRRGPRCPP